MLGGTHKHTHTHTSFIPEKKSLYFIAIRYILLKKKAVTFLMELLSSLTLKKMVIDGMVPKKINYIVHQFPAQGW